VSVPAVNARTANARTAIVYAVSDRPGIVLTRHFFTSLFDFGFLSEEGAESLKRALLGCFAAAFAIGLLLTRVFMTKYGALSMAPAEIYERAVVADHAFLIAVPMWIVAAAVGLVGHSLFPDQTDFRVLMPEPLSRLTIFTSKLASLLLFVFLFIAGAHAALLPLFALTMIPAFGTGSLLAKTMAFAVSSVSGSLCAALAIVAVHGTLVLLAPRARLLAFSGTVRSVLIGLLVLSLPLVARLPATAGAFASGAWWLRWTPPAWFVGLERFLIGDANRASLAAQAAAAMALVFVVTMASYMLLYRRFDRVVLQPAAYQDTRGGSRSLDRWIGRASVRRVVGRFAWITIRRSVLHQGLVVAFLAAAGGFVLNGLLSVDGWNGQLHASGKSTRPPALLLALLGAPLTMMFLAIPAIRLALSVPLDARSNWIFRMTEDAAGRAEAAAANVGLVLALGVALPLALFGPLQWWMLGPSAVGVIVVEALTGWLLVEWFMAGWRRIPFTCSYIPGKGFVPLMFVKAFHAYVFFVFLATLILRLSFDRPRVWLAVAVLVGVAAGTLSLRRSRHADGTPLIFSDELPTDVNPLRLDAD
jgi:hypothetical protein